MSGAEKLKERILAESDKQAEQALEEARQRAEQIIAKGKQDAAGRKQAILDQARIQAEEKRRRAQTIARLDARKNTLSAKETLIEDIFSQALTRLQEMPRDEYQELILPILLEAAQGGGSQELIVSPYDRERYTPEFLARVNKALSKKDQLTLSDEVREMHGGFILRSGEVEGNCSFNSILRMQRDQLEPDVAQILFGG